MLFRSLAENYFRGFKRVENRGTYSTPIGAAEQIQVVRGPPTPIYGPGKVGGLLNFIPKSGKNEGGYLSEPTGEVTVTYGSYNKKNATAQVGLPANFGDVVGGVYLYGEAEDSHSYYKGIYPRRQTGEVSADDLLHTVGPQREFPVACHNIDAQQLRRFDHVLTTRPHCSCGALPGIAAVE